MATATLLEESATDNLLELRAKIWKSLRRRIKRPTLVYAALIQQSLQPDCLEYGVDRSIELQALLCMDGNWEEKAVEVSSMEELDVPYLRHDGCRKKPSPPPLIGQRQQIHLSLRGELLLRGEEVVRRREAKS